MQKHHTNNVHKTVNKQRRLLNNKQDQIQALLQPRKPVNNQSNNIIGNIIRILLLKQGQRKLSKTVSFSKYRVISYRNFKIYNDV